MLAAPDGWRNFKRGPTGFSLIDLLVSWIKKPRRLRGRLFRYAFPLLRRRARKFSGSKCSSSNPSPVTPPQLTGMRQRKGISPTSLFDEET